MKKVFATLVAAVVVSTSVFAADPPDAATASVASRPNAEGGKKSASKVSNQSGATLKKFVQHEAAVDDQQRKNRNIDYQKSEQRAMDQRREAQRQIQQQELRRQEQQRQMRQR